MKPSLLAASQLLLHCLAPATIAETTAPVTPPAGYALVFQDEFEGGKLDSTKWGMPSYKEREAALINQPGTHVVSEGFLKLRAFEKEGKVHCPIIDTRGRFQRTYGWFECRMKMHRLQGIHSCFWIQTPTFHQFPNDPAKSGTEMDVIEWFGAGRRSGWAGMNVYFRGEKGAVRSPSVAHFTRMGGPVEGDPKSPLGDLSKEFHVYTAHWTPEFVVYYCDGKEILRETAAISRVDQYIVLSLLCSHWERPRLKLEELPDEAVVDYVRVYAKKSAQ